MAAMERLNWFYYTISSDYLIKNFGSHELKINAALFQNIYPSIANQYGADQELEVQLKFKKPHVKFGEDDNDITFYTDIDVGLKLLGSMNYLIYDEVTFKMAGDFNIDEEVIRGNLNSLEFLMGGYDQTRSLPVFHEDVDINEESYEKFWKFIHHYSEQYLSYVNNNVLASGIPMPYWNLEFLTHTTFHPHAAIVVMDLFYNDGDL